MDFINLLNEMTFEEKAVLAVYGHVLSTAGVPRLSVAPVQTSDGPAGVRRLLREKLMEEFGDEPDPAIVQTSSIPGGDTCFPTASALGATWNRDLLFTVGQALGRDCIEEGVQVLLAPSVNMKRWPLCGRNFEYFSEDPVLAGELAACYINGLQAAGVGACVKHFAANNQDEDRGVINVEVDERTLREVYLRVFEIILAKSDPLMLMCAYNKINGIYCSENRYLLTEILKEEWGYKNCVVSDWGAVHNLPKALAAGLHLQMPNNPDAVAQLRKGIEDGRLTIHDLDAAAQGVLKLMDDLRTIQQPPVPYDREAQHKIAQDAAREAIVLLKNEDNILPIDSAKHKKIAVLGYFAEKPMIRAHGGSGAVTVADESIDSPLAYIQAYAGDAEIVYEPLYDFKCGASDYPNLIRTQKALRDVDLAIFFAGYHPDDEVEGRDRPRGNLPKHMEELADEVCKFCKNSIIVMQTGAAVFPFMKNGTPKAIVQMWYGGEGAGSAIAEVLFGKCNPSGKLSETFMNSLNPALDYPGDGQKVLYTEGAAIGYRYYDRHPAQVWYPFGHGLSYTEFAYADLQITPESSNDPQAAVRVSCTLTNTGKLAGGEVVQLYVRKADSVVSRPEKELRDFAKVFLAPGETKTIVFTLTGRAFAYYNTNIRAWHVESGAYEILLASSSADIRLRGCYHVAWDGDFTRKPE